MKRRFDERQQRHTTSNRRRWVDETDDEPPEAPKQPRANQAEIDAILDKIRKSGYDSLTKEEKKKLFEQSQQS